MQKLPVHVKRVVITRAGSKGVATQQLVVIMQQLIAA